MIAYCREENRSSAIGSFYHVIDGFTGEAKDFVADLKVLGNPADRQEWPKAEANLASYARWWGVCLKRLSGQMDHERKDVIGGQPEFLEALGPEAVNIMLAGEAGQYVRGDRQAGSHAARRSDHALLPPGGASEGRGRQEAGGGASGQGGRRLHTTHAPRTARAV